MTVSFQISSELEQQLRREVADLDAAAKEAFLVSLYRQGKLTHHSLAEALGLDRFQTEEILHKYNVTEDLGTPEDYLADLKTLDELFAARALMLVVADTSPFIGLIKIDCLHVLPRLFGQVAVPSEVLHELHAKARAAAIR